MRRALVLSGLVVALAGCGGGETASPTAETVEGTIPTQEAPKGDPAAGKEVFASAGCGSCHTLKDAGSTGTIGPNLDEVKPDLQLALERVTNGKSPMPAFKDSLTEQQIADVAAYVVQATGGA
jgi:mono/diheme cytochrome c family protein